MHGQALRSFGDPRIPEVEAPVASSYGDHEHEKPAWSDGIHALWPIVVRERARALTIMLVALLAGAASIWLTRPVYSALATIQIDTQGSRLLRTESLAANPEWTQDDGAFQRQLDLLASRETAEHVTKNLNLANDPSFLREVGLQNQPAGWMRTDKVAAAVQHRLSVSSPRQTDIVAIRFYSHDPVTAARIANTYAETFIRDSLERQLFSGAFSRGFRRGQFEVAKLRLEEAERRLFLGANVGSSGALNDALSKAQANLVEAEQRWQQAISAPPIGDSVSIVDRAEAPARPAYPRPAMNLALAVLIGALALGGDIARSRVKERAQDSGDAERNFDAPSLAVVPPSPSPQKADANISDKVTAPGHRERDFDPPPAAAVSPPPSPQAADSGMSDKVKAPRDRERDAPSPAAVPPSPSAQPADGGTSNTVNGPDDLDLDFDAPLLGIVPLPRDGEDFLLAMLDPPPWAAEAHHAIFLALDEIVRTGDHRVLLLTSISPHEGKSMIAVRLSASFAAAGKKVLMIDADMRRGSLHRMLGLSNSVGFTDLLAADSAHQLTNVAQSCEVGGFSVVPRGEPAANPTELLASKRLADVLDEAVDHYDVVIMEGPPALGVVDAPCLSGMADVTVFVLQADRTRREHAKLAIRRLSQAGAGQIALVISTCDPARNITPDGRPDHAPSRNHAIGMAGQFVAEEPPRAKPAPAQFHPLHRNRREREETS